MNISVPLVHINHCYLVVDTDTYNAIRSNSFLRELFAHAYEEDNASDENFSWKGYYLKGENTYLEIFAPQPEQDEFAHIGNSGIAFGTDEKGDLSRLQARLSPNFPKVQTHSFTRMIDGGKKSWFQYLINGTDRLTDYLSLWVMEYDESYFVEPGNISRSYYNSKDYDSTKLLKDIIEIHINMVSEGFERSHEFLQAFCMFESKDDRSCSFYLTDFKLYISTVNDTHSVGIKNIVFQLNKEEVSQVLELNESIFKIEKDKAVWQFSPSQKF